MSNFVFEDFGTLFNVSGTCEIFETGNNDPTSLIKTSTSWLIRVRMRTEGPLNAFLHGNFRLRARMESIGPNPEFNLPLLMDVLEPLTPSPAAAIDYVETITTPAGLVPPGAYKLVTTVTWEDSGVPGPIAGYCEGPILQFYASV